VKVQHSSLYSLRLSHCSCL